MGDISTIGWGVIAFLGALIFIIILLGMRRGIKAGIAGQTIEILGNDGQPQKADNIGLMYIMNEFCRSIEEHKKEKLDSIVPDLEYDLEQIGSIACLSLRAESILNARRRRNGFDKIKTEKAYSDYFTRMLTEMRSKLLSEIEKVRGCTIQPIRDLDDKVLSAVVKTFILTAMTACLDEYKAKAEMYERFLPQFKSLKDEPRVELCEKKGKIHRERIENLSSLIDRIEKGVI